MVQLTGSGHKDDFGDLGKDFTPQVDSKVAGEYTPHTYKFVISPYYANYMLFKKLPNDDTSDWEMVANCASGKGVIRKMVHEEVDRIFDEYDHAPRKANK